MKSLMMLWMVAVLALGGCATQPVGSTLKPDVSTTGDENDAHQRARIHTELASGYYELANYGVALEEVNEALRADPNYVPAFNVAGLVYAQLKEERLAEQNFERALRINPLDSDTNNNYGLYLCQRKREEEGIRHFLTAVRNPLYQTPDRSYVNAGLCARGRGDLDAAQGYFMQALKVRPNQRQALYQVADILYAKGSYAEAKDYLARIRDAGNSPEVLWLALRVERKLGDSNSEASYAQQLRKNFPGSKEARALLAGQYE
jgi:type IV pilus assembly protein PilF